MEWVLRSPQIHSTFGNLGFMHADGYVINENCNAALQTILHNILTEDKYLRTYRRSISFGQNVQKDIIPLLIHAKEDKTIELLIRILLNLTIPIECLLSVEVVSRSDFGRHTVFEVNNLLATTKAAFMDIRATKAVIESLNKNVDAEQQSKITLEQSTNISNVLLLLRNVLHIPEDVNCTTLGNNRPRHAVQNQILWNIFSLSIDKVLIKLMTIPEATNWGVTMVQLIALFYKDQHIATLHKLLNMWLETGLSESSEDNESNTSLRDRGREDSCPMLTSDPTSDSSDTGGSGKSNDEPNSENNGWGARSENNTIENVNDSSQQPLSDENDIIMRDRSELEVFNNDEEMKSENEDTSILENAPSSSNQETTTKIEKHNIKSENFDCGYGTQIENQESISTSSNDDEVPAKKPVHQKPHNPKQRINNKVRLGTTLQERKRKKIVKRGKANIINVQGLTHKTPTDDDISNILKEFTVDFLLKGYNSLVQTLHSQILTNLQLEIDTSHFFWLVTYFLKFATQIELDLEHICSVLSFDMVSYLTAEGVNLCEQFELAIKLDGSDLKPSIRRLHLVVTAIRESVQAIGLYRNFTHICSEDQKGLAALQSKICELDELRSLLVLLLRHYNQKYHSKQYLQDLIVTNHILLMFVDKATKCSDYSGSTDMLAHLKQFATPEIMYQYGLLLEDYAVNGEFVNDCVFTMMHHVGGDIGSLICLFQPKILKTFTSIWKSEFEICDDWSDLIEYVINTFIKKPHTLQSTASFRLNTESFDDENVLNKALETAPLGKQENQSTYLEKRKPCHSNGSNSSKDRWTEEELSSLSWNYLQCNTLPDVVGEIVKSLKEDGTTKSRDSVIKELLNQNIINQEEFEKLSKRECDRNSEIKQMNKEIKDVEIRKLCEQLRQDGKTKCFEWVQKVLLDTCYAKLYLKKKYTREYISRRDNCNILQFKLFNQEFNELPVMSSVSYHSLLMNQSVPLVPWNCEQAAMCKDLKFLQLLHKLGFQMPVDTGKVFIRISHLWSPDLLYEVAGRVADIDTSLLKFSIKDITDSTAYLTPQCNAALSMENFYQKNTHRSLAAMVNFTPMLGPSFDLECVSSNDSSKHCWLEVVKQSQEIKLLCSLGSQSDEALVEPEGKLVRNTESLIVESVPETAAVEAPALSQIATLPTKAQPALFNTQLTEELLSEDNNSVCETASVASDLTRMYVSDEDEKADLAPRLRRKVKIQLSMEGIPAAQILEAPSLEGS